MIGTILKSRYHIISLLKVGGNGETFIAEDLHIPGLVKSRYLVKRLRPDIMDDETQRLFHQEAQILHDLSKEHEQLPKVIAYFQEKDDFYLIQDWIVGHDLRQEFKPGKQCQESYIIKLLYDVLTVLSFVHQKRVIHRDIKPRNIMRRQGDDKLFLIDFGTVKQVKQQTMLRTNTINSN
ncbi:MAG TPA: protein kinase [Allocoleopsis sp.]